LHTCDNKWCINPDHIYAGTHAQNMRDIAERGRRLGKCTGEKNGRAVLTADDVRLIRLSDDAPSKLAAKYGVSITQIIKIIQRKLWKHL